MASGLNKVMLIGNLGADPELRYTQGGQPVTNFRMATNETWNDRSGNRQERTEWHRIVAFGKRGELCNQYLQRGSQVYVEGRLQTRQWEDRSGNKRSTTEVVARTVLFLDSRGGGGGRQMDDAPPYDDGPTGGDMNDGGADYGLPPDDDYPF